MRAVLLFAILISGTVAEAATDDLLLAPSEVRVVAGAKAKIQVKARWRGPIGTPAPGDATLRIAGGPGEGDSGLIELPAERWSTAKGGAVLRYDDPTGSAGGIERVVLRSGRQGGRVLIRGGRKHWAFRLDAPQTRLAVILTLGGKRWCAEIPAGRVRNGKQRARGKAKEPPPACPCIDDFASTWEAIQTVVFERHGCTSVLCHGAAPGEGDLDLRAEAAWSELVGVPSAADPAMLRVKPGDSEASLLWRKLAARTLGGIDIPNSPMPFGDQPPLSTNELKAIERWIYNGAPAAGVVAGTTELLASCLPPPDPHKITPPDPPAPEEGVQLYSPPWTVPANGEDEVCFAVPYDVSGTVPAEHRFPCPDAWGGPEVECFAFGRVELTQDPNSHHSILRTYRGAYDLSHPGWGTFTCHGGPHDGEPCDPSALDVPPPLGGACGERSACAGAVTPGVACVNYGPPDLSVGAVGLEADSANAPSLLIATEPVFGIGYPLDVANVRPLRGILVVNSHAFNVTATPTTNEQWINLYFPDPAHRKYAIVDIFDGNDIFVMRVPPFEEREYCRTRTFAKGTRLFELFSHTHKRGRLFRAWTPPIAEECSSAAGGTCLPEARDPVLVTTDYADPDQVLFDPPLALTSDDPAERRVKFCAIYDNGKSDPRDVKRLSTRTEGSNGCTAAELVCTDGPNKGQPCNGDHTQCPGGLCDACPLRGGVTTDDEMFVLLGSYYCPEDSDCYTPLLP
ncbi:MAG TPA: hypothetical protein VNO26_13275 [Candidatus Limnocylindria bacterium]|nr:hypothetical protein [Candidatus Limnocylindria bacterium]